MDLALGFVLGFWALPWLWMAALTAVFLMDIVLCEHDEFGWGTSLVLTGTAVIAWLGADINPFTWLWANLADVFKFSVGYFLVGAVWSVVKWYFFLLKVREQVKSGDYPFPGSQKQTNKRPQASYAANNKARLTGWIGHWPFSMVGTLIGDFLSRIVTAIFNMLSNCYERIGKQVFSGFDEIK